MASQEYPTRNRGDVAHSIARAAISAIPYIGGPAAELFTLVIAPPLEKRRDEWMNSIGEGLQNLSDKVKGLRFENLSDNEAFITCVLQATQAAIRNHHTEKLEALRNAVLNSALPNAPADDLQLMFLNYIDSLTTWHLRILKFFENPRGWGKQHGLTFSRCSIGDTPRRILEEAFPDLRGQREFYDVLIRDLFGRGLMNTESLHTTMTEQGIFSSRVTGIGKQFIDFITSPLDSEIGTTEG
jgi:hypothetical protein